MSYALPNSERTLSFMGLSSLLHAALFIATSMLVILAPKPKPAEVITIEIQSLPKSSGGLAGLSSGPAGALAPAVPTKSLSKQARAEKSQPAVKSAPVKAARHSLQSKAKSHDAIVIPVKSHTRQTLAKTAKAPRNPVASPRRAATPRIAHASPVQKTGPVVLPNVDFDQALHEEISDLDDKDFQDDFDKAEKMAVKHLAKKSDSELKQIEKELQSTEEDQKQAAALLEKDIQEQNSLMEKRSKDRLQQSLAAMEKQAAAQAAAEAAAAAKARQSRNGAGGSSGRNSNSFGGNDPDGDPNSDRLAGNRNGHGSGGRNSGEGLGGTGQGGIRSLDELKQMPGNARPSYSQEDRFRRRQGNVIFQAYINSAGKPIKFSMSKSSGHPTLDEKTLEALKKWKFYPGQEGWVEIPFLWDLKGGPQPMPSLLRRNASR